VKQSKDANIEQSPPVDSDDRKWGVRTVYISWVAVNGGRDAIGGRREAEALAKRLTAEHLAEPYDPEQQLVAYIATPYSGWDPAREDEMAEFWKEHGINPATERQP